MDEDERKLWKAEVNREVGARLAQLRRNNKCSQEKYAEILELDTGHYKSLERGSYAIHPGYLKILSEKCHLDINYLVTGQPTQEFDVELFLNSSNLEQKKAFYDIAYLYARNMMAWNEEDEHKKTERTARAPESAGKSEIFRQSDSKHKGDSKHKK